MLLMPGLMKRRKIYLLSSLILLLSGLLVWVMLLLGQNTYYHGIRVDGTDIGGLKQEEAHRLILQRIQDKYGWKKITLQSDAGLHEYSQRDISFQYLVDRTLDKAFGIGRSGNLYQRIRQIVILRSQPIDLSLEINYDEDKLRNILKSIKKQTDKKEKSAAILYKKGTITIQHEEPGRSMDIENNFNLVDNQLRDGNFNINLYVEEIVPWVTYDKINEVSGVLAAFSTNFNPADTNRSYNIVLASERINGIILLPGDIFSMHKALGPRTLENGYREAPVIYKNELVQGTGGGVCQVTTTLYNSILLSKIEVLERTHHSMPLGYVKPGQDATIAEDYIDFKFHNSTAFPICISSEVVGGTLNVRLLGKKEPLAHGVKLRPEIIEQYPADGEELIVDNNLADNEKVKTRDAKNGLKVILYRETYDTDGTIIQREKITEDVYKPVKVQYKVNQKTYDALKGKPANQ